MPMPDHERLRAIRTFPQLVKYLRDDLEWPIDSQSADDLMFDYEPEELGLEPKQAVKVRGIKQLRPLADGQPWGIFFIDFEPKRLPVVVLRRILRALVVKKRKSANPAQQAVWQLHDLLFISSYGESDHRDITFAHFADDAAIPGSDLPTLKVLGWDDEDTALHIAEADRVLRQNLRWPQDTDDLDRWRAAWSQAFTIQHGEVIRTAKDLAVRMAELATRIRNRVNRLLAVESEKGPLNRLMQAFRQSLIHDLTPDDFADMYAQTITYGLLSARVSRHAGPDEPGVLQAEDAADLVPITNPFLRELMATFLHIGGRVRRNGPQGPGLDFDELGVAEVVEALNEANMSAVLRDFGDRNPQEDPVIHFYELFLKQYDPKKRMQRGVFYTPRPVVSFIVRSVHELLQTEFGLEDGLASTVTWREFVDRQKARDPQSQVAIPEGTDPQSPFVVVLDPATGTATFLVEVIVLIHRTMTDKWRRAGRMELEFPRLWNEYVPKHLLPRLYGYELMMAPYAIAHMKIGLMLGETGYRFGSDERANVYLTNALEPPQDFSGNFEQWAPALAHEATAVNDVKRHQRFTVVIGNPPYSKMSANLGDYAVRLIEPFRYVGNERIVERGALAHEINLQDDYVKFYALMFRSLESSSTGIGSFISNFRYLDSPSLRGLRHRALSLFDCLDLLHIGGHVADRNVLADSDDNVFDIEQGVAIAVLRRKCSPTTQRHVRYVRLLGDRGSKYESLAASTVQTLAVDLLKPSPPFYNFRPAAGGEEAEFRGWIGLDELLPVNSGCVITSRDNLAIGFSPEELLDVVRRFAQSKAGDTQFQHDIGFSVKAKWDIESCKQLINRLGIRRDFVRPILYRPFDLRYIYYLPQLLDTPSRPVSELLVKRDNVVLLTPKVKTTHEFNHALACRDTAEKKVCSHDRATQMFPLWCDSVGQRVPNIVKSHFRSRSVVDDPESVFQYCYAILHSGKYRKRYGQVLREVFPRIPQTRESSLFDALIALGDELLHLHLMEVSPGKSITSYSGRGNSEVEMISYSSSTVWLDKQMTRGFAGVPEAVWNFHIGGYQVCEKWLKDRKGRTLSAEDIAHYQKIVVALSETIRIMAEIDKVIDAHGGWPGAFVTTPLAVADEASPISTTDASSHAVNASHRRPSHGQEDTNRADAESDQSATGFQLRSDPLPEPKLPGVDEAPEAAPAGRNAAPPPISEREPFEIMAAIRQVFDDGIERDRDAAIRDVARALGYERIGDRIRESLDGDIRAAVRRGILQNANGCLSILCRTIDGYTRDHLVEMLLSDMGGRWWYRDEIIRATARYLGFRRTGPTITKALKSAINGAIRRGLLESEGPRVRRVP